MKESNIQSGRKKGFVVLFRDVAQDNRLSLEARGLFTMMVSLPENWEYTVSGLAIKAGCSKDKIRRLLGELQEVGYLLREQSHNSAGKFAANTYVLQDEAPLSENPDNGEKNEAPLSGNPDNGEGKTAPLSGNTVNGKNRQRRNPSTGFPTQKNKEEKKTEPKNPPHTPQRGERRSKYAPDEKARALLRDYAGEDRQLAEALEGFMDTRTQLRAINSVHAVGQVLGKLDRLSGGDPEQKLQLIAQSVENSWKGIFPLKGTMGQAVPAGNAPLVEERGTYLL